MASLQARPAPVSRRDRRARRVDARRGLRVNSPVMALQAAIDGQGVALARAVNAADDLREKRIIRPFRFACATNYSYYLLHPAGLPLSKAASAFCRWLKNEAEEFQKKQNSRAQIEERGRGRLAMQRLPRTRHPTDG